MAVSVTLHCLTGCAIGEITGLMIGTAARWANGATIAVSIVLAFVAALVAFMIGGLIVSIAAGSGDTEDTHSAPTRMINTHPTPDR